MDIYAVSDEALNELNGRFIISDEDETSQTNLMDIPEGTQEGLDNMDSYSDQIDPIEPGAVEDETLVTTSTVHADNYDVEEDDNINESISSTTNDVSAPTRVKRVIRSRRGGNGFVSTPSTKVQSENESNQTPSKTASRNPFLPHFAQESIQEKEKKVELPNTSQPVQERRRPTTTIVPPNTLRRRNKPQIINRKKDKVSDNIDSFGHPLGRNVSDDEVSSFRRNREISAETRSLMKETQETKDPKNNPHVDSFGNPLYRGANNQEISSFRQNREMVKETRSLLDAHLRVQAQESSQRHKSLRSHQEKDMGSGDDDVKGDDEDSMPAFLR